MNAINWFEIPVTNFARARQFYESILATELKLDESFPGMRMALFPGDEVCGCLVEFAESRPHADGVRIYLNGGENLGPILDRVVPAGGTVIMPKTFLREDIGFIGMFRDSEGNIVGLHSLH